MVELSQGEKDVMMAPEVGMMCFEDERRDCEPRNAGSLSQLEKIRKPNLVESLQKECSPANALSFLF